jgi:putative membrane protein
MKRFTFLAILAGLIVFSLIVAYSGAGDIVQAVQDAGWATLIVVLARAVAVSVTGVAWRVLFPPTERLGLWASIVLRWVREGVNGLLPVAQIGGDFIGARLATFFRVEPSLAGATVIVDVAVQALTQLLFALLGLAILLWLGVDAAIVRYVASGLLVAAIGLAGFFVVQRRMGSRLLTGLIGRFAAGRDWIGLAAIERLYARLQAIYADRGALAWSAAIHSAVWIFGAVEVWVALHFMGYPIGFGEAVVIESLGQAVRGAAFAVPGGIGVQEGGFVALCALFGVPPGPAVALSLLKRVADLALGLPGLLAWQVLEARHALKRDGWDEARPLAEKRG